MENRELRKAGTAARLAVSATEGASLGGGREQKLTKDIEQLVGDKGQLETEIRNLQSRVSESDEELRLANQHASLTNDLYAEELAVAEAEKLSAEEARLHASRVYGMQLESAIGQTAIYSGMGAMLTTAHAERFRLEQDLLDEQLGRREDVSRMHDEMLKLRKHLETEMRAGLEAFREQYQEEAQAQLGAEAKEAIVRRYEYQSRASQEHAWAETWQKRYERTRQRADEQRLGLEMQLEAGELQAKKLLALKRRVGHLKESEARAERLAQAYLELEATNSRLRDEVARCKHEVQIANRQTARALHAEARRKAEAERHPHERATLKGASASPLLQPRSEAILRLASFGDSAGLDDGGGGLGGLDGDPAAEAARWEPCWKSQPGCPPASVSHIEGAIPTAFSWAGQDERTLTPLQDGALQAPYGVAHGNSGSSSSESLEQQQQRQQQGQQQQQQQRPQVAPSPLDVAAPSEDGGLALPTRPTTAPVVDAASGATPPAVALEGDRSFFLTSSQPLSEAIAVAPRSSAQRAVPSPTAYSAYSAYPEPWHSSSPRPATAHARLGNVPVKKARPVNPAPSAARLSQPQAMTMRLDGTEPPRQRPRSSGSGGGKRAPTPAATPVAAPAATPAAAAALPSSTALAAAAAANRRVGTTGQSFATEHADAAPLLIAGRAARPAQSALGSGALHTLGGHTLGGTPQCGVPFRGASRAARALTPSASTGAIPNADAPCVTSASLVASASLAASVSLAASAPNLIGEAHANACFTGGVGAAVAATVSGASRVSTAQEMQQRRQQALRQQQRQQQQQPHQPQPHQPRRPPQHAGSSGQQALVVVAPLGRPTSAGPGGGARPPADGRPRTAHWASSHPAVSRSGLSGMGTANLDPLQLILPVEPPLAKGWQPPSRPQPSLLVGAAKAPPPMRSRGERALMAATAPGTGVVALREGSAVWLCGSA